MSQKIMLASRLSPELIEEINAQAAAHSCDVDSLLSIALDSLKRIERGDVQLSDRVEKMQIRKCFGSA